MGISNTIQQLSVFLENREGRLDTVLKIGRASCRERV